MTSEPERPRRYPLQRRRRRPLWRRAYDRLRPLAARLPRVSPVRLVAIAILGCVLLLAGYAVHRSHRPDPVAEQAMAWATLAQGNYSAARRHAQAAVTVAPRTGTPHALLARVALAQGDGVVAEGELARAVAYGWDRRRGAAMLAEARLLQGDADGAIEAAAKAAPDQAAAAGRVTARAQAANDDVPAAQATLAAVLARAPRDAGAWRDLARIRFDADDVLGATAAAARALAIAQGGGTDPDLLVLEGEIVRRRYGLTASLPWFRAALARDAYHVPALLDVAATLGDMGRYPEMLDAARRVLAARPGEPRALYLLAVMAARAGQADLARAMLAHAGTAVAQVPGALLLGGILDYQAGKWEQALRRFKTLAGLQPYNIVARRLLGMALLRSGDPRGALDALRPVAQRGDADTDTLTLAARGFEVTGARGMATTLLDRAAAPPPPGIAPFGSDDDVQTLQQAVAAAPNDPVRVLELVRSLVEAQRFPDALSLAKALSEDGSGTPEAWRLLGDVQVAMNRPADAATAYARAADLAFDEPTMLRLVGALAAAGQRVPAARALALYLAQNPASVPAMRMAAGLQVEAGDWGHAIATLERLRTRLGNRDAVLLTQLSVAYLGAGDAAAALACGRAAYRLQPMNAGAADAYGWALYALGDAAGDGGAGGRDLLRKAAVLAPRDPGIAAHVAAAAAR